jgi:NAD(P)-dependent dehydrogenase (short-subunit alcohol dehydrogenase family)
MRFRDRNIVITGASSGIGAGLATALCAEGARVTLAARSREALDEVAAACRARGGEALVVPTDVTDPEQCRRLVDEAVRAFGGVDVLVNNAGLSMWARVDEVTDLSVFERVMKVNYLGAVYCTHHALPHVRRSRGLLVAISSLTGKTGVPTRAGYAATKHAMQGFFDSLRVELRHTGVDVTVISPGFVGTDVRAHALGGDGRPLGASPRDEARGTMSVAQCVSICVEAIASRRREVVMTAQARLGMFLKLVAPSVVDAMAARAIGDHGGRG